VTVAAFHSCCAREKQAAHETGQRLICPGKVATALEERAEASRQCARIGVPTVEFDASCREKKNGTKRFGLAFVPPAWGGSLEVNDFVVLMDSTHQTNRWDWYLFTVLVRDSHCSWRPGACFLTESQHSNLIAAGLRAVRQLAPQFAPQFVITDDSAAEQSAWRDFSPSTQALLCQKHWKTTVFRRLPGRDLSRARRPIQLQRVMECWDDAETRLPLPEFAALSPRSFISPLPSPGRPAKRIRVSASAASTATAAAAAAAATSATTALTTAISWAAPPSTAPALMTGPPQPPPSQVATEWPGIASLWPFGSVDAQGGTGHVNSGAFDAGATRFS
jgi:hypothetical protein